MRRRNSQHATDAPARGGARIQFAKAGGHTRKHKAPLHNDKLAYGLRWGTEQTQHKSPPMNNDEGKPRGGSNAAKTPLPDKSDRENELSDPENP